MRTRRFATIGLAAILCGLSFSPSYAQDAVFPVGRDDETSIVRKPDVTCHITKDFHSDWSDGFFEQGGVCAFRNNTEINVVISDSIAFRNLNYLIDNKMLDSRFYNVNIEENKFQILNDLSMHLSLFYTRESFNIVNNSNFSAINISHISFFKNGEIKYPEIILKFSISKYIFERINFDKVSMYDIPIISGNYYQSPYFQNSLLREEQGFWK